NLSQLPQMDTYRPWAALVAYRTHCACVAPSRPRLCSQLHGGLLLAAAEPAPACIHDTEHHHDCHEDVAGKYRQILRPHASQPIHPKIEGGIVNLAQFPTQ